MQNLLFVDFSLLNVFGSYFLFQILYPLPPLPLLEKQKILQRKLINLETYTVADIEYLQQYKFPSSKDKIKTNQQSYSDNLLEIYRLSLVDVSLTKNLNLIRKHLELVLRTHEQNFVNFNSFLQIRRQEQLKMAWLRWGRKIKSLEDFTGISFWQEGLVETPNFWQKNRSVNKCHLILLATFWTKKKTHSVKIHERQTACACVR